MYKIIFVRFHVRFHVINITQYYMLHNINIINTVRPHGLCFLVLVMDYWWKEVETWKSRSHCWLALGQTYLWRLFPLPLKWRWTSSSCWLCGKLSPVAKDFTRGREWSVWKIGFFNLENTFPLESWRLHLSVCKISMATVDIHQLT